MIGISLYLSPFIYVAALIWSGIYNILLIFKNIPTPDRLNDFKDIFRQRSENKNHPKPNDDPTKKEDKDSTEENTQEEDTYEDTSKQIDTILKKIYNMGDRDECSYKHILHGLTALYWLGSWKKMEDYTTPGCFQEKVEPYWDEIAEIFEKVGKEKFNKIIKCDYRMDLYKKLVVTESEITKTTVTDLTEPTEPIKPTKESYCIIA